MIWDEVKRALTTPPPPRPPPPKYPLFTKDPFSTTSFGPGHLVGAVVLVGGLVGLTTFLVKRGQRQAEETRRLLARPGMPPGYLPPQPSGPSLARVENGRGEYGRRTP